MSGCADLEAILALNAADFYVHAEDRRRWKALMDREGVVRDFTVRVRRHGGAIIWVRHSSRAVRDATGSIRYYEGVLEDITERKRAEEGMRETNETLRALIEASPLAIITYDPDGNVRMWNRTAEHLFGWTAQEVIGRPAPFVSEEVQDEFRALRERGLRGESFTGVEVRRRRRDGSPIDLSVSMAPFYDTRGAVGGTVAVIADISERRRREEALRHSKKLAEMGSLLAGVAHELNNPLAIVVGQASLLEQALKGGGHGARAREIGKAGERCARIVQNFLALARQRPTERREVRLNQVVEEAVELLAYPLRVDSTAVSLDLSPALPVLWADPHQLHQVVVNLVTNAHQAMRETPPPRRLTVTTRNEGGEGRVSLEVADTGPGIPSEMQARIFEPFFTTKPAGQGTGLGLSICQGIIEAHGGSLRLTSRPGRGATFRIELPVESPPEDLAAAPPAEAAPPIRGKAILVVDDEPVIAELLGELLGADGHRVDATTDGAQALARLREQSYDLILSDVRMPELDGPDLYREATRVHPRLRRRFIFMTGDLMGPHTQKFLEETRVVNLSKPFSLGEVREAVRRVLREADTTP